MGKFVAGHTVKAVHDALQMDKNRLAEKDEFETKQNKLQVIGRAVDVPMEMRRTRERRRRRGKGKG